MAMRGEAHKNTQKVIEHLAQLYEKWDKPDRAAQWRAKLLTATPAPDAIGQEP
jgi:tRNA uridine 5-carbamoylmethylation protein Kti12